jgi:hypothetical protein
VEGTKLPLTGDSVFCNIEYQCGTSEVEKSLHLKASLSAKSKAEFASKLKTTSTSVSMIVSARKVHGTVRGSVEGAGVDLKPDVSTANINDFLSLYGDSYVDSVTYGSEYYAVYTFFTESVEDQSALASKLSLKVGMSGKGTAGANIKEVLAETHTGYTFVQWMTGVEGVDVQLPNQNEICGFALSFTNLKFNDGTVLEYTTSGYEKVPGFRKLFVKKDLIDTMVSNRGWMMEVLDGVDQTAKVKADIDTILEVYAMHGYYSWRKTDCRLAHASDSAAKDMDNVKKLIEKWRNNLENKWYLTTDSVQIRPLHGGSPSINVYNDSTAPWGNRSHGQAFDDSPEGDYYPHRTLVKYVRTSGARLQGSMTTKYTYLHDHPDQQVKEDWAMYCTIVTTNDGSDA